MYMSLYNEYMIDYQTIQSNIYTKLQAANLTIDPKLADHPRACAELIETFIQHNLYDCIEEEISVYSHSTTAKSLADCSCYHDDNYYAFDIKTHRMGKWGMPNVTSYKKLDRFYQTSSNRFVVILVDYTVNADSVILPHAVRVAPIEQIPWEYLAVQGTLGQIQIINAEKVEVNRLQDRDEWINEFYEQVQVGIKRKLHLLNEELDHFTAHGNIEYNVII